MSSTVNKVHFESAAGLLKDKVALVTGGSGAIGGAIASALAQCDAKVAIHYFRRESEAKDRAGKINARGKVACVVSADITNADEVSKMVGSIHSELGEIDILVNNAAATPGTVGMKDFLDHTWGDYQKYIDTILKGTFHCCRAVLSDMIKKGNGRIINIGTTSLYEINAHLNPYVVAKGGLYGMTHSLAEEFGKHNITVNQVVPGWIWSEENRAPANNEGLVFRQRSPLGIGLATPDDVAGAVVFLASDMARMVTGVSIPVCAGQVMF